MARKRSVMLSIGIAIAVIGVFGLLAGVFGMEYMGMPPEIALVILVVGIVWIGIYALVKVLAARRDS